MTITDIASLAIAVLTLMGVAAGRFPVLRMNRATIAIVGAVAVVLVGGLSFDEAIQAVDAHTIALLFAMMVVNVNLRLAGFFHVLNTRILSIARTPRQLLLLVISASGVLSSLFLNDTIVLMFTPLLLDVVLALRRNPLPYLLGLMMAANIGSAATVVGNPQNMIIGVASGIGFIDFTVALLLPSLLGMLLLHGMLVLGFREEFHRGRLTAPALPRPRVYLPLLRKSLVALGIMLVALIAGMPVSLAALGAASMLLLTRRLKPERVFRELDWSLLVFFIGLFITTAALHKGVAGEALLRFSTSFGVDEIPGLALLSLFASNLISNVPAVMLLAPMVRALPEPTLLWLTLAMATTFAGNLTILGSVANMIVVEAARGRGVHVGFLSYLRLGVPVTVVTLLLGTLWMLWLAG